MMFDGIRIPGANMDYCNCNFQSFNGADINSVSFRRGKLKDPRWRYAYRELCESSKKA